MVGRTDYRLTIHSPASGPGYSASSSAVTSEGPRAGIQEITYSTYTPNSFDRALAEFWSKAGSSQRMWNEEDGTDAKVVRVELGHDGVAVGVEPGGGFKWIKDLGNIG